MSLFREQSSLDGDVELDVDHIDKAFFHGHTNQTDALVDEVSAHPVQVECPAATHVAAEDMCVTIAQQSAGLFYAGFDCRHGWLISRTTGWFHKVRLRSGKAGYGLREP